MSTVHVYTAPLQPATKYTDDMFDPPALIECSGFKRYTAWCCRKRRQARYLNVQVFYDGIRSWCAPGSGCKKGKK